MSYKVTASFSNGYRCQCCRSTWTVNDIVDTIEDAAQWVHDQKHSVSTGDEFDGYEVLPTEELSRADSEAFSAKFEAMETSRAEREATKQARAAFIEEARRMTETLRAKKAALEKNRPLFNDAAIVAAEAEIRKLQAALDVRVGSEPLAAGVAG